MPRYMWTEGTSANVMFSHIGIRNIQSMLFGLLFGLLFISIILLFLFRSWSIGLVSLIVNLFPISVAFGIWGIFDGEVGVGISMVLGMVIGIIVDDTVHSLVKYQQARRELLSKQEAIRKMIGTVGKSISITMFITCCGFLVLSQYHYRLNAEIGLMTSIVVAIALVLDLLLLPSLLFLFDRPAKLSTPSIVTANKECSNLMS